MSGDGSVGPGEVPPAARESLKIMQIQGSSAGSGSGDFHTYRNARNIERERIAKMEQQAKEDEERMSFERQRAINNFYLEQEQMKKSEKRKRKKQTKAEHVKKAKLEAMNQLPNDGSFMEQFLKQQAAAAAAATTVEAAAEATPAEAATTEATTNQTEEAKQDAPEPKKEEETKAASE